MNDDIVPREVGRPTKLDDSIVVKLESILKIGGTVEEACSYALINKTTYYRWIKEDENFATKMLSAQHYADIVAKNVVVDSMIKDRNVDTAKWWLEKRQFKDKANLTQVNVNNMKVEFIEGEYVESEAPQGAIDSSEGQTQV